jgi:PAS domain S-box-containing protein
MASDQPGPASGRPWDGPRVGSFRFLTRENRWEWSDAVAAMHGYEPGTVTPTTELILSHKHPDDKPTVAELIDQVRREGIPFSSRHRIIDTAGKTHLVVVVGDRCRDDDGQLIGTAGFYVDVTDEYNADMQRTLDDFVSTISERRAVINQAIGMLMLGYGVPADRAFEILAWRSQETNVKLRDIATRLVDAVTTAALLPSGAASRLDNMLLTAHQREPEAQPQDLMG